MDVLIPLGNKSKFNDQELKYCLRSIEKYLNGFERIFIIGELPRFINPDSIVYIPLKESNRTGRKEYNIFSKIIAAIDAGISEWFYFTNDDHFLLEELSTTDLPNYYDGTIDEWIEKKGGKYHIALQNTIKGKYFDVHTPIVYNSDLFQKSVGGLDWSKEYVIKSSYCNFLGLDGIEIKDPILRGSDREPKGKIFSTDPYSFGNVRGFLHERFPDKSRFEK